MSKTETLQDWIRGNSWNLLITAVAVILSFAYLNFRVEAIAKQVETNTGIIAKFPTEQWFNLKFQMIDENQKRIEEAIKEHINERK